MFPSTYFGTITMKHSDVLAKSQRKTGRPLSFDADAALEAAMLTFWRHGYETTSIADLTAAMGITPPSLYTAFGDKKRLFLAAVGLYIGDLDAMAQSIANAPSGYDAARDMLTGSAMAFTNEATPPGCLLASATASGSAAASDVQAEVAAIRAAIATMLCNRIKRDISEGVLSLKTDATALADFAIAVIQGMSVLARDGADQSALIAIAKTALSAWPHKA
jgi:AcrR family transcriptional regulator